ncbi:DUF6270 domain-containing protein [Phenylobacterium sp.]|uniref:DUF6270 domain-containing protein n=1 Tax=Phenylobacterium sp. TaxID=1871053 RepID=UPI0012043181|nr:DUF6270 domain-containing protein [Phenylobacterium sp.]THD60802.1 MAG: hypothetical protein E8A12_10450 [Phenylobacterium sp.]
MSRVAIVGSCISRDLWRFRGETDTQASTELLYVSRTSLPSLFATRLQGFRAVAKPPGGLKAQPHRALVADLSKTAIAALVAFRPTHLIFDFIDERFDLLSAGGALITDSWELEASGYRKQPAFRGARTVPRLSAACERLWLDGAAQMAALVRATPLAQAQLILHSSRWADRRRTAQGRTAAMSGVEILPGRPGDLAAHNALLARYETTFAELMPPMARVEAPDLRVADDRHLWGQSPFHYVPAYYAAIRDQLTQLGVRPQLAA